MWKLVLAFAVFAGIVVFVLMKSGADVDLGGEKHGIEATPAAPAPSASTSSAY